MAIQAEPEASTGSYGLQYAMPLQEWRMMDLMTKAPSPVCRVLHSLHSSCFVIHCGNDSSGHLRPLSAVRRGMPLLLQTPVNDLDYSIPLPCRVALPSLDGFPHFD